MLSGNRIYIFFQISAARTGACANIDATLLVERSKLIQTNLTEPYVEISWKNWFVSWKVRRLAWAEHYWYENGNMVFFAFHCIWCFPAIFVYFWKIWHFYFNIFYHPRKRLTISIFYRKFVSLTRGCNDLTKWTTTNHISQSVAVKFIWRSQKLDTKK